MDNMSSQLNTRFRSSSFGAHDIETSAIYPDPLVVDPTMEHKMTFVVLHGRGSEAFNFGSHLLEPKESFWLNSSTKRNLRMEFPNAKFVFPTAAKRRAQGSNRIMINQWFDYHSPLSVEAQCQDEDWQLEGLHETCKFIHRLLLHEISIVGAHNVVLSGLSQGCAASLIALLLWDGPPLRAMFGMCGWLPLRMRLEKILENPPSEAGLNVQFREDGDANESLSPDGLSQSLQYLRDQLDFFPGSPGSTLTFQSIPIFLGHGELDEKVPIELAREATDCLKSLGANVKLREYQDLGHWYSPQMLGDFAEFLVTLGTQTGDP